MALLAAGSLELKFQIELAFLCGYFLTTHLGAQLVHSKEIISVRHLQLEKKIICSNGGAISHF